MKPLKHINWKIALFTALLLPVLLSLGFWQLSREAEKIQIQAVYESRFHGTPIGLGELKALPAEEQNWIPVELTGRYDNDHSFLLDNRTHEGRPGFEVITPFILDEGDVVLINRGWLARGQYRQDLPELDTIAGSITLVANVYIPEGQAFMLGAEEPFNSWPRVLQAIDINLMFEELDIAAPGYPRTLRIQEGMPGAYGRYWQAVNMGPEKHRGYAVQWFTMAAVLVLMFLYTIYSSVKRAGKENDE